MNEPVRAPSDEYTYEDLTSERSIRVLKLFPDAGASEIRISLPEITLPEDSETDAFPYTALSYTWGSPEDAHWRIRVDDATTTIRNNLYRALQALRDPDRIVTLWVDALCINQQGILEKNHQVSMMASIYRMAQGVRIWLGPADENSHKVFNYAHDRYGRTSLVGGQGPAPSMPTDAIVAFAQRGYWSRVWIVQEVLLAPTKDLQLHCGADCMPWDWWTAMCQSVHHKLPQSSALHLVEQRTAVLENDDLLLTQTLESLIRKYCRSECADRRDRVFALLSLACDCVLGQTFQADYGLPRLELLVKLLRFCRPDDPIGFVSIVFRMLQKAEGDDAWKKAAIEWDRCSISNLSDAHHQYRRPAGHIGRVITVAQFRGVSTYNGNWARCFSACATLEVGCMEAAAEPRPSFATTLSRPTAFQPNSWEYDDVVFEIDEFNVAILLNEAQVAILSTSQPKAVAMITAKPCVVLGLCEAARDCACKFSELRQL